MFRRQLLAAIAGFALIALPATMSAQNGSDAAPAQAGARVSIVHLAPFSAEDTTVSVTVNGVPLPSTFEYKSPPTPYQTLPAGDYEVALYAGTDLEADPIITDTLNFEAGKDYTVLAVGDKVGDGPGNIPVQLLRLENDNTPPGSINFNLRIVHAAPFAEQAQTGVDVVLEDDTPIPGLQNVPFGAASPYIPLPGGAPLDVKVLRTGTSDELFNPDPLTADAGKIITAVAIGGVNDYEAELFLIDADQLEPQIYYIYMPAIFDEAVFTEE